MKATRKSVGILGGAFDPVHLGHLSLAEDAIAELDLDEVWFVPTARSPLKKNQPHLGAADRLELLSVALESCNKFIVDRSEIEHGGVSYTIDSVRRFKEQYPEVDFGWIIGGDQVEQLDKWKEIEELSLLIRFIVVSRPGFNVGKGLELNVSSLRLTEVTSRNLNIASSRIRERIAAGKPVNDLLPKRVADLIVERNYYSV